MWGLHPAAVTSGSGRACNNRAVKYVRTPDKAGRRSKNSAITVGDFSSKCYLKCSFVLPSQTLLVTGGRGDPSDFMRLALHTGHCHE